MDDHIGGAVVGDVSRVFPSLARNSLLGDFILEVLPVSPKWSSDVRRILVKAAAQKLIYFAPSSLTREGFLPRTVLIPGSVIVS